jgi:hypothetical protein
MSQNQRRVAQPGDLFLLLVPSARELHQLTLWQSELQAKYGGQVESFVHITCQRFTPNKGEIEDTCIGQLVDVLATTKSFMIYTDKLIQFLAPYWGQEVLRWRVQETQEYAAFRDVLTVSLKNIGCPSHFNRKRHTTCTALKQVKKEDFKMDPPEVQYPSPLFTARNLWFSKLLDGTEFEILEKIKLAD